MARRPARAASPQAASQRQLKVGERMRHVIAQALMRGDVHDRRLEGTSVTVSEVQASRDLRHGTVFVSELGRPLSKEVAQALEQAAPWLGGVVAREANLKYAPKLHFVEDRLFAEAERIETLLDRELGAERRGRDSEEVWRERDPSLGSSSADPSEG